MEVDGSTPFSEGEEDDTQPVAEDVPPMKGYGKKSDFFGTKSARRESQSGEDTKNGMDYDNKENDSVYDSPGGHVHTHRHKKFRRHHLDDAERSLSGSSKYEQDEVAESGDMEDGEILEDGEIAEEDGEDADDKEVSEEYEHRSSPSKRSSIERSESSKSSPGSSSREHRHSRRRERRHDEEKEAGEGKEEGEDDKGERSHKDKRKKKRSKKDRHERKDRDKKRKRHGRDFNYKDPDRPDDEDMLSFDKRSRSPPGPYDSPLYDNQQYDNPSHGRSPSKRRNNNSPGHCDYGYDSPPGLYDSPSYDEDSEDENGSLMRALSGTGYDGDYMDQQGHSRKRKADHRNHNRRRDDEGPPIQGPPRKKPLLEIPRHERPHCKFYMEGKCAKGKSCPFNHDFRPPKKPEVCKFYLQTNCSKGNNCIYMHGEYPCKYFHTGTECYQGDNCKFSHDPLTDDTRPLLEKILHGDESEKPRPALLET